MHHRKSLIVVALGLASLAACSDEHGVLFTLRGPGTATSVEIVLADPGTVTSIPQRPDGKMFAYYKQRSTTHAITGVGVIEGFQIRLEAGESDEPDRTYVPIALAFDGGELIGVGRIGGEPQKMQIPTDRIESYELTVEAGGLVAACAGKTSGYRFHFAGGPEYRLVVPLDGSLDATANLADLDCDGDSADAPPDDDRGGDCNDLAPAIYANAPETCGSTLDENCDGSGSTTKTCTFGPANECTGAKSCTDANATCIAINRLDEACACVDKRCFDCTVPSFTEVELNVCAPASEFLIGMCPAVLTTVGGTACNLTVDTKPNGWTIQFISPDDPLQVVDSVVIGAGHEVGIVATAEQGMTAPAATSFTIKTVADNTVGPTFKELHVYSLGLGQTPVANMCPVNARDQSRSRMTCTIRP